MNENLVFHLNAGAVCILSFNLFCVLFLVVSFSHLKNQLEVFLAVKCLYPCLHIYRIHKLEATLEQILANSGVSN